MSDRNIKNTMFFQSFIIRIKTWKLSEMYSSNIVLFMNT